MSGPSLAVVGHANKGKSSLVAALAQDESVRIGREPGTTTRAQAFPMHVDGEVLYTLVDTPGFQRARAALAWMQEQAGSAVDRPGVVARFVDVHRDDQRFDAECELLKPITEGAGLLYVVDGAVPYSSEYEPEMEILRWTGQPSIAVINPIGGDAHVDDWRRALNQYFRIVRVIDAVTAPFERRLQVLSAFAELREDWRDSLNRAADALTAERSRARRKSSNAIAALVEFALTHREEHRVAGDDDPRAFESRLAGQYRRAMRREERRCRNMIEALYRHEQLKRSESEMEFLDDDLFSEDTWLRFGLSRTGLVQVGVVGGALAGFGLDATLGGTSMLLGAGIGAAVGGAASWFSAGALAKLKIKKLPVGGRLARYGPSTNPNLFFVLVGRARAHHDVVAGRSHAKRDVANIDFAGALNPLDAGQRQRFAKAFESIRKSDIGSARRSKAMTALGREIESLLQPENAADVD